MSVRQRSYDWLSSNAIASDTDCARAVSSPMRDSVNSRSSRRSGSSSTSSTFGCPRSRVLRVMLHSPLFFLRLYGTFHGDSEIGSRSFREKLERGGVGVRQFAGNVQAQAGAAGAGSEKWLEDLAAQFGGDAGAVIVQLADDGV